VLHPDNWTKPEREAWGRAQKGITWLLRMEGVEKRPCPSCQGRGSVGKTTNTCRRCGGKKEISL
jgi:DnaJ-class molecular chaperone